MNFFEELFFNKAILVTNETSFQPGYIEVSDQVSLVNKPSVVVDDHLSYIPIDIYDQGNLIGEYRMGKKTYEGMTQYVYSFYPSLGAKITWYTARGEK